MTVYRTAPTSAVKAEVVGRKRRNSGICLLIGSALAFMFSTISPASASIAYAQEALPDSATKARQFQIPRQSLDEALEQFSAHTGVKFAYRTDDVDGLRSAPVTGELTPDQALTRMLTGTGLVSRRVSSQTIVVAQTATDTVVDASAVTLPQVVVTGEKEGRTVFDTVSSVGIVTAEDIENSTILDTNDVIRRIANVTSSFGGEGIVIRGIPSSSVSGDAFTSGPVITTYIDNAPLSGFALRNGPEGLWDVEQVEVLRGVQSTKQGRNSLAGAVHIKSKDPVFFNEAAGRIGFSEQNGRVYSVMGNGIVIDDLLAIRFSADRISTDGFNSNLTLGIDDQAEKSETTFRGKVRFDPKIFDGSSHVLTLSYTENRSGDDALDPTDPAARNFFGNIQGHENLNQAIVALDSDIDLNETLSLRNIVTWNRSEYDRLDDDNGTLAASNYIITGTGIPAGLNDIGNPERRERTNTEEIFTEEIRLHHDGERLKAHGGFYYADINTDDNRIFLGGLDSLALDPNLAGLVTPGFFPARAEILNPQDFTIDETNWALFGEANYDLTKLITVFGGIRYDVHEQDRTLTSNPSFTNLVDPATVPAAFQPEVTGANAAANALLTNRNDTGSSKDQAVLPSGGLTFNLSDNLKVSGLAKRGYRAGGGAISTLQGIPFTFDPEFVWDYELSVRSRLFDDKLDLNANVFYMDWTDQQVAAQTNVNGFTDQIIVNAGKSELKGFELEARARPSEKINLFGSVGYVKTKFIDFPVPGGGNLKGNEFPFAPEWTLSGGGQYTFNNGMFVQADASYQSKAFTLAQNDPTLTLDAHTVVNARVGYQKNGYMIYGFATNLFDEVYVTNNVRAQSPGNPSRNLIKVGDGRTFGVRMKVKLN
ncbi:MAG: TonB-dependent receptor [Hyphomicrobiaceae bacterium]|nr:TonB-dependent receptor [Hyphomicrobiaceae bacterium]